MSTKVTYVFGDIYTGAIISEIALYGVSMARGFGIGELRGSFQLDQTGKENDDLVSATEPGRCYVVCERDEQPIWGGIVWTRTYQSQAKVFQLYCKAYEHYPERRLIRTNFLNTDVEQRNIFRTLWSNLLADPNSIQIDIPSAFPTEVVRTLDVKAAEFKTYRSAMDQIANVDDGFDWTIDVARVGEAYTRTLRIGYPTLGTTDPDAAVSFDYPGSITNYWQNSSMASTGTHLYAIGAGEGTTMLTAEVIHSDLVASHFPRYDLDVSMKGINNATVLTNAAVQVARIRKAPGTIITAETKADQDPVFGGYGLGDRSNIYFKDARYPTGFTFTSRVLGWEYYPPSDDSIEMARLVFEGEDL